jgi:hypothetical protein
MPYLKVRFIVVTSGYSSKRSKLTLSVDGITGILASNVEGHTTLKHISHNNGGYEIIESVSEVLELIKNSNPI